MASPHRLPAVALAEQLRREPYRFSFYQAVQVLHWLEPLRPSIGEDGPADEEPVLFAAHLSLAFPPSDLVELDPLAEPLLPDSPWRRLRRATQPGPAEEAAAGRAVVPLTPARLEQAFLGLIGPNGVLPRVYTEAVLELPRNQRVPLLDFLDLFHHRLVSLLYRAWEKYRLAPRWEHARRQGLAVVGAASARGVRTGSRPASDPVARLFLSLMGLGLPCLQDRHDVGDEALVFYAGLYAQQHRSALGLERLLSDHFGQAVEVISFVGQWLHLRPEDRTRVGVGGAFQGLGVDTVAGRRVWDEQSRFRVRMGPVDLATFHDFLPGSRGATRLRELVRLYVRGEFDFDLQVVLRFDQVPDCVVSRQSGRGRRLGMTTWLKAKPRQRDGDEPIFRARD